MDDSTASTDFRWAKDSYASMNHPTVGTEGDVTGPTRQLARFEQDSGNLNNMRRLARMLDQYRTPVNAAPMGLPAVAASTPLHRQTTLPNPGVPQAASSPRSEAFADRSLRSPREPTPDLTQRSSSPIEHSHSRSWRQRPIPEITLDDISQRGEASFLARPPAGESKSTAPTPQQQARQQHALRQPRLEEVEEVSYGTSTPLQETPSPMRPDSVQQYWTAKQSARQQHDLSIIESLRVASPSLRPAGSVTGSLPDRSPTRHMELDDSAVDARSQHSRAPSDLSRVDSQETSLQAAISNALQASTSHDVLPSTAGGKAPSLPSQTPIEDAIVARYRQSLGRFGQRTPQRDHREPMPRPLSATGSQLPTARQEPVKPGSPLVQQVEPSAAVLPASAQATPAQPVAAAASDDVIMALGTVVEECSRRGEMIEQLEREAEAESSRHTTATHRLQADLDTAQRTAQALEARVQAYEDELQAMKAQVQTLAQQRDLDTQQHRVRLAEVQTLMQEQKQQQLLQRLTEKVLTPQSIRMQDVRRRPAIESVADEQEDAAREHEYEQDIAAVPAHLSREESLRDKMDRWNDGSNLIDPALAHVHAQLQTHAPAPSPRPLHIEPSVVMAAMPDSAPAAALAPAALQQKVNNVDASISRAQTALHQPDPPADLLTEDAARKPADKIDRHRELAYMVKENAELRALLASATLQLEANSRERAENYDRPAAPASIISAHAPADARRIRPEHMADFSVRAGRSETYDRLCLARIDALSPTACANLLKNVFVQLDIPADDAPRRVTELASRLAASSATAAAAAADFAAQATTRAAEDDVLRHELLKLREFADCVHATLYAGASIVAPLSLPAGTSADGRRGAGQAIAKEQGVDRACLEHMADRVLKLQRIYCETRRSHNVRLQQRDRAAAAATATTAAAGSRSGSRPDSAGHARASAT